MQTPLMKVQLNSTPGEARSWEESLHQDLNDRFSWKPGEKGLVGEGDSTVHLGSPIRGKNHLDKFKIGT